MVSVRGFQRKSLITFKFGFLGRRAKPFLSFIFQFMSQQLGLNGKKKQYSYLCFLMQKSQNILDCQQGYPNDIENHSFLIRLCYKLSTEKVLNCTHCQGTGTEVSSLPRCSILHIVTKTSISTQDYARQ